MCREAEGRFSPSARCPAAPEDDFMASLADMPYGSQHQDLLGDLQEVLGVQGLHKVSASRAASPWTAAEAAAVHSSLAEAAAEFMQWRTGAQGTSLAELLIVRPPTEHGPRRSMLAADPATHQITADQATHQMAVPVAAAAAPPALYGTQMLEQLASPSQGSPARGRMHAARSQPLVCKLDPDVISEESGAWQLHGSGVYTLLNGAVGAQQRPALPYDFAWSLLMERCVFEAPFAERWVLRWLEGHFRSRLP